jgi:hypothetical protein
MRLAVLADRGRVAAGITLVVIPYRLLFDGYRRDVGEPTALIVGSLEIGQKGQSGVAVMDHGLLYPSNERPDLRISDISGGQVARAASGSKKGANGGIQARGREVRIGLAELKRSPLRVTELPPALAIAAQTQEVGPAELLAGPTQRHCHGPRHGHDQRRGGDDARRRILRHQLEAGTVGVGGALLQQPHPG